jgi:hypothetical protein
MNKALACLSFFKRNKISYYYEETSNLITFPCFKCRYQAGMDTTTTKWNCVKCGNKGNLVTLINDTKCNSAVEIKEVKIFNPSKEKREVRKLAKKIDEKYQSNDTAKLRVKIDQLLKYLNEKTS